MFAFAAEHKYVPAAPKVRMCREPKRLPRVVAPHRLTALMDACDAALPAGLPGVAPAAWRRGLFGFLYMTGWRIGEAMRPCSAETDLDALQVVTLAGTNKANRDDRVPPHPAAAALLVPLRGGPAAEVFPWPHHRRALDTEFVTIQTAAGVAAPFHGFHDFRRSFATFNANGLGAETLKRMMRHQSYATTQKYIRMAEDLSPVIGKLFVPNALKPPVPAPKKGLETKGG